MSLNGSQTLENLKAAFAGESQANRRYLYFAKVADIEGSTFPAKELDSHYLFVARDLPLPDRHDDGSYWTWTDEPTIMTSDMHRGYVVSDGWDETHFTRGATLTVDIEGPKLQLLTFRSSIHDRIAQWIRF